MAIFEAITRDRHYIRNNDNMQIIYPNLNVKISDHNFIESLLLLMNLN